MGTFGLGFALENALNGALTASKKNENDPQQVGVGAPTSNQTALQAALSVFSPKPEEAKVSLETSANAFGVSKTEPQTPNGTIVAEGAKSPASEMVKSPENKSSTPVPTAVEGTTQEPTISPSKTDPLGAKTTETNPAKTGTESGSPTSQTLEKKPEAPTVKETFKINTANTYTYYSRSETSTSDVTPSRSSREITNPSKNSSSESSDTTTDSSETAKSVSTAEYLTIQADVDRNNDGELSSTELRAYVSALESRLTNLDILDSRLGMDWNRASLKSRLKAQLNDTDSLRSRLELAEFLSLNNSIEGPAASGREGFIQFFA